MTQSYLFALSQFYNSHTITSTTFLSALSCLRYKIYTSSLAFFFFQDARLATIGYNITMWPSKTENGRTPATVPSAIGLTQYHQLLSPILWTKHTYISVLYDNSTGEFFIYDSLIFNTNISDTVQHFHISFNIVFSICLVGHVNRRKHPTSFYSDTYRVYVSQMVYIRDIWKLTRQLHLYAKLSCHLPAEVRTTT